MSNWNFGGSNRLNGGGADTGMLDLKALLNQVTGGSLGGALGGSLGGALGGSLGPLGGLTAAVGSGGGRSGGGYGGGGGCYDSSTPSSRSSGGGLGFGVIGGGGGGGNRSLEDRNDDSPFFDPFSSMSTFGFFNPKDPGGGQQMSGGGLHGGMGGGGGGGGGGGHSKSPTYHTNNSMSPVFGGGGSSHSPINFFGGSSSCNTQFNSSSSNTNYPGNDKFSIGTFSINDTIPGRERENSSSSNIYGSDDNSSSNGHFGTNSSQYGNSSNYRGDRDNYGGSHSNRDNNTSSQQGNTSSSTTNRTNEHGDNSFNQGVRETGIIEKLLHSYGFIQCCERQARLFFHFSQFDGTIEHLKLGDPVEFEMTYDRRTGKPIASSVTKIGPEVVLSEERVTGTVTTELHHESSGELQGRISYENRGECFFLPYCQEDIEGNVTLSVGDTVSFQIATNQRSGNLTARYVRLENPARPVRYKGIVSSLKDNFGFIERADVAKEIFFHFSETRITDSITVTDNVEFNIQSRNGKEVACTITKLPLGTVVFEDIGADTLKGQILKPIDKTQCPSPTIGPTPRSESSEGRLRYRGPDRQELEVVYGEKDQKGSFTMKHGDWVQFHLAVDRRNKQQRATHVTLLEESFSVSGERREEGVISAIKGDCGYITCAERDSKMYFRFSELLDYTRHPRIADDVEFTIIQDLTSPIRQTGIRIKYLKHGAVQFEIPVSQGLHGVVVREPSTAWVSQEALAGILPSLSNLGLPANVTERLIQSLSSAEVLAQLSSGGIGGNGSVGNERETQGEPGLIQYQMNNGWEQDTIIFHWKDCKHLRNISVGTKVGFDIHQVRRNRDFVAANIRADGEELRICGSGMSSLLETFSVLPTEQLTINCNGQLGQDEGKGRDGSESISLLSTTINSGGVGGSDNLLNTSGPSGIGGGDKKIALLDSVYKNGGSPYHQQLPTVPSSIRQSSSNPTSAYLSGLRRSSSVENINGSLESESNDFYSSASAGSIDDLQQLESCQLGDGDVDEVRGQSPLDDKGMKAMYSSSFIGGSAGSPPPALTKNPRVVMKGYIAALKDGFGFIETMAQDGEIFFHSSSLVGDFSALEVGQEVEYVVSSKGSSSGKNAADIVKPLPKGSIGRAAVFPDILQGIVVRPLRGANPDQTEYTGLIDGQDGQAYPFGIISMLNKKELLQAGEGVEFQLDSQGKPVNIRAIRKKLRAAVEAVKGQYGFLSYELEDGKKLFFHMSEVKDHQHLNPGDEVEFVILLNPRNGKSSACSVVKVGVVAHNSRESQRPERLLNRLSKLSVDESAPRLVVLRQPYGPDGTRGFNQPRVTRKPGCVSLSRDCRDRESTSSTGSN